jgi:hypothetical protein
MTWSKISDHFPTQPAILRLSDAAFRLHVTALCYGNQHTTDGLIDVNSLYALGIRKADPEELAAECVNAGIWSVVEADPEDPSDEGGWQLDWTDQEPATVVKRRRKRQNEKGRRDRLRQELHRADDHRLCASKTACPHADPRNARRPILDGEPGDLPSDALGDTPGDSRDPGPARPDPTRPPKGGGGGKGGRRGSTSSAGATAATAFPPGTTPWQLGITPRVTVRKTS